MENYDYIVVGAGVFGLTIARHLLLQKKSKILVLEKEREIGLHTSGRNSGVLHRGIYYPPDSLKAKFCVKGANQIVEYCEQRKLNLKKTGKVILPLSKEDDGKLDQLANRARENGAEISVIDKKQLSEIEPEARSLSDRALYSPLTYVIDPRQVLRSLAQDVQSGGVKIQFNAEVKEISIKNKSIKMPIGEFGYGHLVNTAGLHADKIAKACGVGRRYTILPFKGIYSKISKESDLKIRGLIYPVPDLRVPFLGVHFTTAVDGNVYIGPTALPAFGRENYSGLSGLNLKDFSSILYHLSEQFIMNRGGYFREFTYREIGHLFKNCIVKEARAMVPRIQKRDIVSSTKVGIRAQLLDLEKMELVMDFRVESEPNMTHVLNAVSPGWTSAMSFAEYLFPQ